MGEGTEDREDTRRLRQDCGDAPRSKTAWSDQKVDEAKNKFRVRLRREQILQSYGLLIFVS